ncbi:light-harvesting protein [Wenzhouxiangella sp. XN79A]|uniref:light-harvesting antenna LH1, beta subunit n=1 Tax=Wenzhouxiangella sp. XN79A TaxID=2724193 RepID=UPI00144A9E2F|nr:light-harvesting antenna LH1, beta subunit [Wenzhouxiangella sp. XN79A]NKI34857.1 light-harvesting protein [Wenzhouxiangella sp. XN79A]
MDNQDPKKSISGLSEKEAKEFHKIFVVSFIVFTAIAVIAHILAWQWRPWIPGPEGYAAVESASTAVTSFIASIS